MSRFRHLETTTVAEARCHRCGARILTALDSGAPARVNATPLRDRHAEISALLDGLRTYNHTHYHQLHYRDENELRKPAARHPIHAEHKCTRNEQLSLDIGAK